MRKYSVWFVALLAAGFVLTSAPKEADAAFRLGADALWMPVAFQNIEDSNAELDSDHELASFGASAHANLGFDIFSIGLKLNYFNQAVAFAGTDDRFEELDINLMARIGIPTVDLALFAEGGLATNPSFDYFGYNIGAGIEYALISLPLLDFNLGVMGQYVNVSDVEFTIQDGVHETANLTEGRGLVYLGVDFGL